MRLPYNFSAPSRDASPRSQSLPACGGLHLGTHSAYFFTAIAAEYCVFSHISFNTPSAMVFSTAIVN